MQSGINFPFSLWRPYYNNTAGAVLPAFYGQLFTAEFRGPERNLSVVNFDSGLAHLSAYAAYNGEKLARVALVNLELWDGHHSRPSSRNHTYIALDIPAGMEKVTVKKLTSNFGGTARETDQITWGGMSWTYQNEGKAESITNGLEELTVKGGVGNLKLAASEAAIIFL